MITLEVLSSIRGHTTIHVDDVEPDKRAELAQTVTRLIQEGHVVFLDQGNEARRVQGYDATSNEWIVFSTAQESKAKKTRISGRRSRATAVAPTAGG